MKIVYLNFAEGLSKVAETGELSSFINISIYFKPSGSSWQGISFAVCIRYFLVLRDQYATCVDFTVFVTEQIIKKFRAGQTHTSAHL